MLTQIGELYRHDLKKNPRLKYLKGVINLKAIGLNMDIPIIIFQNKYKNKDDNRPFAKIMLDFQKS